MIYVALTGLKYITDLNERADALGYIYSAPNGAEK